MALGFGLHVKEDPRGVGVSHVLARFRGIPPRRNENGGVERGEEVFQGNVAETQAKKIVERSF